MKRIARLLDFKNHSQEFAISLALVATLFFGGIASYAMAATQNVTLSVVVNTALTFAIQTNNFTNINPGTVQFATTTLDVVTNDSSGWNVGLGGTNAGNAGTYNLQSGSNSIPDQAQWVNPVAGTTTVGDAVRIGSFSNSQNVLAFRVMTASSTNGVSFTAPTWWGTTDSYVDSATTLWAGIASSSPVRVIGNAGVGSYSSTDHINTVLYYLNVATTQPTGTYSAPVTYTATGN